MFEYNGANATAKSRVRGSALVVFCKNERLVETLEMANFRAIQVAKEGFAKHGPVTMLVKQKGEAWRYFEWKNKQMGTTHRRACLNYLDWLKVSAELKMLSMIGEWD